MELLILAILLIVESQDHVQAQLTIVFTIQDGNGKEVSLMASVARIAIAQVQRVALIIDVFVLLEDARIIKEIV